MRPFPYVVRRRSPWAAPPSAGSAAASEVTDVPRYAADAPAYELRRVYPAAGQELWGTTPGAQKYVSEHGMLEKAKRAARRRQRNDQANAALAQRVPELEAPTSTPTATERREAASEGSANGAGAHPRPVTQRLRTALSAPGGAEFLAGRRTLCHTSI